MAETGRRFEEDFSVPEMLIAAHPMQPGLTLLKPALQEADVAPRDHRNRQEQFARYQKKNWYR
jgi:hypothetical protein